MLDNAFLISSSRAQSRDLSCTRVNGECETAEERRPRRRLEKDAFVLLCELQERFLNFARNDETRMPYYPRKRHMVDRDFQNR